MLPFTYKKYLYKLRVILSIPIAIYSVNKFYFCGKMKIMLTKIPCMLEFFVG
jgi:hypothetical protein